MKIAIAYDSKYGNGRLCAEYLESVLKGKGHDARLFYIRDAKPQEIPSSDLYVFSTPTHAGSVPFKMRGFLRKASMAKGAKYALITTRGAPKSNTFNKMDEILGARGMSRVGEGLVIKVLGMKGPLEEGYKAIIDEFAGMITASSAAAARPDNSPR